MQICVTFLHYCKFSNKIVIHIVLHMLAKNVKALRERLNMSQEKFAILIGATRGSVAQYELGNNNPGAEPLIRICKITNKTVQELTKHNYDFSYLEPLTFKGKKASDIDKLQPRSETSEDGNNDEGTPIYEMAATAGELENVSQMPDMPSFHVKVPGYEDCNFGMHVYGHSMYPTIENGSLILCRKVNDKTVIMYGEIYLIRTADYLMVKRIQKNGKASNVLCTSDNFEKRSEDFRRFEPFELPVDKIIDLYLVKGIIKKTQS